MEIPFPSPNSEISSPNQIKINVPASKVNTKEKNSIGRYVKELMSSGALIPDEKVIELVNSYITKPEYRTGYLLDGFPRTLTQAKKFRNHVDKVIHLKIPDKEALWRLAYRNEVRDDDTIEAIKKRIELFDTHTRPVLKYYEKEGKLAEIDGMKAIEEVNEEILKSLGRQKIKNRIQDWKQYGSTILAVVGLPGSGKTEASQYFKQLGLPTVSFSDIVNKYIDKHDMPHTLAVHKKVRESIRATHGFEAMAMLSKKKIEKALEKHKLMIIEGMRSWEEYEYLKKEFSKSRIFILAVFADKLKRYSRIENRPTRSGLKGEERDIDELLNTHMGPTIAFADFVIKNNFSLDDFHEKLSHIYREVLFS